MSTTGIKAGTIATAGERAVTWQMWVPCLAMADNIGTLIVGTVQNLNDHSSS